jgi:hypothetical protein
LCLPSAVAFGAWHLAVIVAAAEIAAAKAIHRPHVLAGEAEWFRVVTVVIVVHNGTLKHNNRMQATRWGAAVGLFSLDFFDHIFSRLKVSRGHAPSVA